MLPNNVADLPLIERSDGRRSGYQIGGLRIPLAWPADRPFRILSIDGGGIRGIFPAAVLARVEQEFTDGVPAGEYFDMIAGTSTGGIIALALGVGIPARDVLALYLQHGSEIFPPNKGLLAAPRRAYQRWVRGFWHYRYEREPLKRRLDDLFASALVGQSSRRLCIPSFDGTYNEVHVFKTPHHPDFHLDWRERIVDVALATAAAPTFFPVYQHRGRRFADGGIWANNPVMIALVDALACYDLPRRSVHILSLGCGDGDLPFTRGQQLHGGLWHWRTVVDVATRLQSQGADGLARALIGSDQVLRISAGGRAASIELDDFSSAHEMMPDEAARAMSRHDEALRAFFREPAQPFRAYHGPRAEVDIADATAG